MIVEIFKNRKLIKKIKVDSLAEAKKIADEKFPKWTDLREKRKQDESLY